MTVSIQTQITRSIPSEGVYRVDVTVIDAVDIEFDVLVFATETATYSHVASVYDMESYPVGQSAAQAAGLAFYRGRSVAVDHSSILDATGFEQVTTNRLKILAVAWNSIVSAFEGTTLVTATSA